ncbi:MAG TPA: NUMOD4 domain-containing protein [Puia sp.]|jgi:hypothetical protein|nr:NUMOD4 domain-containing protein [Puia sp.]
MEHWKNLSIVDIDGEIWRDVVGLESMYLISNFSRLKRKYKYYYGGVGHGWRSLEPKIISQHIHKTGYVQAAIVINKKPWVRKIHRMVAEAFIENNLNLKQVNHIDGNKLNNNVTNLEWCNQEYNMNHASKKGLLIKSQESILLMTGKKKIILQYDLNGKFIREWESITDATSVMSENAIKLCLYGQTKKPKQFVWKYKPS